LGGTIRPDPYSLPVRYKAKHQKNREAHLSFSVFLNIKPERKASWSSRVTRFAGYGAWNECGTAVGRTTDTGHHMRGGFSSWSRQLKGTCLHVSAHRQSEGRFVLLRNDPCANQKRISMSPTIDCHGWGRRCETIEERTGVEASDADADVPLMYIFQIDWASPLLSLFHSRSPHFSTLVDPTSASTGPCVKDRHRKTIDRLMWRVVLCCCARFEVGAA